MTKYLGIDYGLAHIGLATSEHMLATPLLSINNDANLIKQVSDIVMREGIDIVVCGIPEGRLVPIIKDFAAKLGATGTKVILHQETLSTKEATQKLRAAGASRGKLKDDHAYAACLILEDYLELNNSVN